MWVIKMDVKIKNIGNSKGIIIPAHILKALGITNKDNLELVLKNQQIIIYKKAQESTLDDYFKDYEGEYKWELVFTDDKGKEKW
jgi:antitoxin component of MazEF toxin-antitoxin module